MRHGETHWNIASRIQGHSDSGLTDVGRAQADAIARRLAREPFDVLVASDLGRTLETAERIAALTGHAVRADPRFRERSFGAGEGLTYAEVERAYPGAFRADRGIDPDYAIPGGESRRAFQRRIIAAFESLALELADARVVVVTHGGVLGAIYRHASGIPLEAGHRVAITNASYNVLSFDASAWTIHTWADTDHLPRDGCAEES